MKRTPSRKRGGKKRIPVPLPGDSYNVAISWDADGISKVDLDIQALIVDRSGFIIDAVYYNNLMVLNGAVVSWGDEKTGAKDDWDELVTVNLSKLPRDVALIIFVVAAYDGGCLREAANGKVGVIDTTTNRPVSEWKIEQSMADVDVVSIVKKCADGTWALFFVDEPAECGNHFLDILEPTIGDIIRSEISGAPACQRVSFQMEKGAKVDLPKTSALRRLTVGIGGTLPAGATKGVDIDICAVFFSESGDLIGAVDPEHSSMYGVESSPNDPRNRHLDEAMSLDLNQIPENVAHVFLLLIVIHGTFGDVDSTYARIQDQELHELLRHAITAGHHEAGLIIARIYRSAGDRWGFQALGTFFNHHGPSWKTHEAKQAMLHAINLDKSRGKKKKSKKKGHNPAPEPTPEPTVDVAPEAEKEDKAILKPSFSSMYVADVRSRQVSTCTTLAQRGVSNQLPSESEEMAPFKTDVVRRRGGLRLSVQHGMETVGSGGAGSAAGFAGPPGVSSTGGARSSVAIQDTINERLVGEDDGAEPTKNEGRCRCPSGKRFLLFPTC
mmetsp:Transcript_619/g.1459  ORF Transcript_619/g.1459 Transcript_619/m.1459 type:complete len:554 (+) Transcript_619:28-1689(+)